MSRFTDVVADVAGIHWDRNENRAGRAMPGNRRVGTMDVEQSGRYIDRHERRVLTELSTAYHEAAHVVVGYWFGWQLNPDRPDGVVIDGQWITNHRIPLFLRTVEAVFSVNLAGWIAERKFTSHIPPERSVASIEETFKEAENERDEEPEYREGSGDLYDCAMYFLEDYPEPTLETFTKYILACQTLMIELLSRPLIWRAIKKVAKALIARGRLSDDEAQEVIGDDFEDIFEMGVID
jgi:hypothetical protein